MLDFNNEAFRHLGQVADKMSEWEGSIAGQLDLTPADVAAINMRYPKRLKLQTYVILISMMLACLYIVEIKGDVRFVWK